MSDLALFSEQNHNDTEFQINTQIKSSEKQNKIDFSEKTHCSEPIISSKEIITKNSFQGLSMSQPLGKIIKFEYHFFKNNKLVRNAPIELDDELYQPNPENKYFYGLLLQLCYDLEQTVKCFNIIDLQFSKTQMKIPLNVTSIQNVEKQLDQCTKIFEPKLQNKNFSSLKLDELLLLVEVQDFFDKRELVWVFNIEILSQQ